MSDHMTMSWLALLALGAFHGLNPGMGWLFAVALGMQERSRSAVWSALLPLGAGHALAVVAAILVAVLAGAVVPIHDLRWPVALILVIFGVALLIWHRHPRWAQMRVGMGSLTLWSFLMASAHGAGLMVVPLFLGITMVKPHHGHHVVPVAKTIPTALLATAVHAAGYLLVTAFVAVLVYEKLGLAILRKAWFNVDFFWAIALVGAGALTLLL
jgi:hypothetical protein